MSKRWWICGLAAMLWWSASSTNAHAKWSTTKAIVKAREALSMGMLKQWKQALLQGNASFAQERKKMSLPERTNTALWLQLLWAKYYQYMGVLPSIRDVSSFEDQKALQQYIKRFRQSVSYLKLALRHLRNYNGLYTQAMDRAKISSQVYLQASLSLSRDLEERIRSGKIYLAFLRYADKHWGDKQKIQKQLNNQTLDLRKHKKELAGAIKKQRKLDKRQRKMASSMRSAQALFDKYEARASRQRATSIALITVGSILVAGGLGSIGLGIYLHSDDEYLLNCAKTEPKGGTCSDGRKVPNSERFQAITTQQQRNLGITMGVGGGGILLGVVIIIVGAAIGPGSTTSNQAVIKSHNKHLDYERKQRNRRPRSYLPIKRRLHLASSPHNAPVLGRW